MGASRQEGKYYVFALVTVLLWSTAASMVKSLTDSLPSLCILGYTSLFASLFLLLLLLVPQVHNQRLFLDLMDLHLGRTFLSF